MKKSIIVILTAAVCFTSAASREVYNLNDGWKFFNGRATSSDGAGTVMLPHTWNCDAAAGNELYFRGIGNYLKEVNVPASWNGKRVFIKGYGANSVATVFVNGKLAGEHRGGYTAFCFEITDLLKAGTRNYFRIMVNNSPRSDVLPTAGDMNAYGGLFRNVELIVASRSMISLTDHGSDGVYVKQKKITTQRVEAEASIKVSAIGEGTLQARLAVISPTDDTVAVNSVRVKAEAGKTVTAVIPFAFDQPLLWNGRKDPYMYRICVELAEGGNVCDRVDVSTGFRYFSVDPASGFSLNGKPYPLRGVVVHQDRAGAAIALAPAHAKEDVAIIKEMGANAVRVEGVVHHPEFYDLCDREGIVVWSDFPLMGEAYLTDKAFIDTDAFRSNGIDQATDIIRQQYNHPSVMIWGIFSNMHTRDDNPIPYIRQLDALAKREDPTRMTAASSNTDGGINFITDLVCWNHRFGWQEGQPSDISIWKQQHHANWARMRSAVSYGAGASIYHQGSATSRPQWDGSRHPEQWQTFLHETYLSALKDDTAFWGLFVCNMFDYGAVGRTWGDNNGINDMGLVTFDRKERKDAYYLYKANWNDQQPFVYIAERRWIRRTDTAQDIKLYSNLADAELIVNGLSQGRKTAVNGICIWNGVKLKEGVNLIEARAGDRRDFARIEIDAAAKSL